MLTLVETFAVSFSGLRERSGPLCWAQRWTWELLAQLGSGHFRLKTMLVVPVPDGRTIDHVKAVLSSFVARHEVLRTTFALGADGDPVQRVSGRGEFTVQVREAAATPVADLADRFADELATDGFDLAHEPPIRLGVIHTAAAPRAIVLAMAQVGFDAWSLTLIVRELRAMLAAAPGPAKLSPPGDILQPLDQAAFQQSAKGVATATAADHYWRAQLDMAAAVAPPRWRPRGESPRIWCAHFRSPTIARACARIAEDQRVSPAAVMLSGLGALLGHRLGQQICMPQVVFSNRYQPASRMSIGRISQQVPVALEFAEGSFIELVHRTSRRLLRAARHAAFDPMTVGAMTPDPGVHDRNNRLFPVVFNYEHHKVGAAGRGPTEVADAVVPGMDTTLCWPDHADAGSHGLYVCVNDPDNAGMIFWIDTSYVSKADLAAVTFGTERLLRAAAADPEIGLGDLCSVTDVLPAPGRLAPSHLSPGRRSGGSRIEFATAQSSGDR